MSGKEPAMEAERFAALADAYGGQLQRWPLAERASAQRFAATAAGRAYSNSCSRKRPRGCGVFSHRCGLR